MGELQNLTRKKLDEYNKRIGFWKDKIDNMATPSTYAKELEDIFYEVLVDRKRNESHTQGKSLYSGKVVLGHLNTYTRAVMNQNYIGVQKYSDKSKSHSRKTRDAFTFLKIIYEFGSDIIEYLSNRNNKKKNAKWYVAILREHYKPEWEEPTYIGIEFEEPVEINIRSRIDKVVGIKVRLNPRGGKRVTVLSAIPESFGTTESFDGYGNYYSVSIKQLIAFEDIIPYIELAYEEAYKLMKQKSQEMKTVKDIMFEEFRDKLFRMRI
ncbi:MAG: hypothetical protein ACOC80_10525 [Petrotogales bacterium]